MICERWAAQPAPSRPSGLSRGALEHARDRFRDLERRGPEHHAQLGNTLVEDFYTLVCPILREARQQLERARPMRDARREQAVKIRMLRDKRMLFFLSVKLPDRPDAESRKPIPNFVIQRSP
jgi:hypothetical protein